MFLLSEDFLKIKRTKEKGFGVFARKKIAPGKIIGDYLGKMINIAEYDLANDANGLYLMYYSDQVSIYPDLSKPGPHLLNHSCSPNCWISIYQGHTLFFTIKPIVEGEELTISYLLSPNEGTCAPCTHICRCRSKNCSGTMHLEPKKYEIWQTFLNIERKKIKLKKVRFNSFLTPLKTYPNSIPIHSIYARMCS